MIHIPNVKHFYCLEIIGQLGATWSARTFRDKISAKLYSLGYLKENIKIERSTATYFLRQLGMVLVRPKKGIYKDGHERPDTVLKRSIYTSVLNAYHKREKTYEGVHLQIEVPLEDTLKREVVRVYHDECIYASHEGAIQLWVLDGHDGKYKKTRGEIVMASGFRLHMQVHTYNYISLFVCMGLIVRCKNNILFYLYLYICNRCHGMMQIPYNEIGDFLQWSNLTNDQQLTLGDFPMSAKIYAKYDGPEQHMLASFTTIVPGSAKGKDNYWTITDAHMHATEVAYIFQWLHRRPPHEPQPEMHAVFDGSSNHKARPFDALHVGGGICKGPGGANEPGAPLREKNAKNVQYRMNMRDGWYINKGGERITQVMHRAKTWIMDDKNEKSKAIFNEEDGLIFKGVEEILKESEESEKLTAYDGKPMPYRRKKARRTQCKCLSDKVCTPGIKCCMVNTLKYRPDFLEQRCKLEEVCHSNKESSCSFFDL